jgi:hypothetical protein
MTAAAGLSTGRLGCICDPMVWMTLTTGAGSGSMPENREWSEADLQRLADDNVGESLQLEFKACGALSKNPDGKAEIGRDGSAIAAVRAAVSADMLSSLDWAHEFCWSAHSRRLSPQEENA